MERDARERLEGVMRRWAAGGAGRAELVREFARAVQELVGARGVAVGAEAQQVGGPGGAPEDGPAVDPNDPSLGRTRIVTPLGPVIVYVDPRTGTIVGVSGGPGAGMFPGVPVIGDPRPPEPGQQPPGPPPGDPMSGSDGSVTPPAPPTPPGPDDPPIDGAMPGPDNPMMGGSGSGSPPPSEPGDYPEPADPDAGGGMVAADSEGDIVVGGRRVRPLPPSPGPIARNPRDPGYVDPAPDGAGPLLRMSARVIGSVVVDPGPNAGGAHGALPPAPRDLGEVIERRHGGVIDPAGGSREP